jgi:sugar O-acyltransferase (sialic acid O-acetyltransferase NeuD family)
MGNRRLLLIGGGGHCEAVLDSLTHNCLFSDIAIIDKKRIGENILGYPVIGTDEDLRDLRFSGWTDAFITVGSIGITNSRRSLMGLIMNLGFNLPKVIDSTAILAKNITICNGVYIGKGAIVNSGSHLGVCSIINSGAVVEHDCTIGDFVHISPSATLCGSVKVGNDTHIGANASIRQGLSIGSYTLIGMGSVVVKNIPDRVLAYGCPCSVRRNICGLK